MLAWAQGGRGRASRRASLGRKDRSMVRLRAGRAAEETQRRRGPHGDVGGLLIWSCTFVYRYSVGLSASSSIATCRSSCGQRKTSTSTPPKPIRHGSNAVPMTAPESPSSLAVRHSGCADSRERVAEQLRAEAPGVSGLVTAIKPRPGRGLKSSCYTFGQSVATTS